ncbi:MAG: hypothetical protein D8H92_08495, partial [Campylobacter sp.]
RPKFNRLSNAKLSKRAKFGYGRRNSKPDLSKGKFTPKVARSPNSQKACKFKLKRKRHAG